MRRKKSWSWKVLNHYQGIKALLSKWQYLQPSTSTLLVIKGLPKLTLKERLKQRSESHKEELRGVLVSSYGNAISFA